MESNLCESLLQENKKRLHYPYPPIIKYDEIEIDATSAVGSYTSSPENMAPDSPDFFLKNSLYCFPARFNSNDLFLDLTKHIAETLVDYYLFIQKRDQQGSGMLKY